MQPGINSANYVPTEEKAGVSGLSRAETFRQEGSHCYQLVGFVSISYVDVRKVRAGSHRQALL